MFAGKKSAQIREILISESAWEEMTCLFAPSLAKVEHEDEQVNIDNKVDCQAKYEMYINRLALHHVHQECWILNSRPAQLIEF